MSDDATVSYGLVDFEPGDDSQSVVLTISPAGDRLSVMVSSVSETVPVWQRTVGMDWFADETKCGMAANKVRDRVDTKPDAVKDNFTRACEDFGANIERGEVEMRSSDVQQVVDMTQRVVKFKSNEACVTVDFAADDETGHVEIDESEWFSAPVGKIKRRIWGDLDREVELFEEDWDDLRKAWTEQMKVVEEAHTGVDEIVHQVLSGIQTHGNVVGDREAFANSKHTVWYEQEADDFAGEDVLWVKSAAVRKHLTETSKTEGWMGQLSRHLQKQRCIRGGSQQRRVGGTVTSIYPFDPSAIGVSRDDIPGDDDDDMEVEP